VRRTVALAHATLTSGSEQRVVDNSNDLVGPGRLVNGIKTGHTQQAGYVLVGVARRNRVQVLSAVLGDPTEPARIVGGALPDVPGAARVVEVRHQGELLGALTVTKRQGESLTPVEEKLLDDLASQAGLVLKNVGLTAELLARLAPAPLDRAARGEPFEAVAVKGA